MTIMVVIIIGKFLKWGINMIDKLQALFSAYPSLTVTGSWGEYTVNNGNIKECQFLMNVGGGYDIWFYPKDRYTCLSQNMVKVLYNALELLNEDAR